MTVEVLFSAMHLTDFSIYERSRCTTDALIINQTDHEAYEKKIINGHVVRMYSTTQRGLSRSRNMALIHAKGDYCLIADDDEELCEGYEKMITDAFERNPQADAIAFNYHDLNFRLKHSKRKTIQTERESHKNSFFSSVTLAFKREKVLKEGIWFNLKLGAGSGIISTGEESEWESNLRNKGLKLYQCPEFITTVKTETSTWFKGHNESYFYDLGAGLSARYGVMKYLYQFYFPLRLRKETMLSVRKQLYYMNAGMKGFKKGLGFQQYFDSLKALIPLIVSAIVGGGKNIVFKNTNRAHIPAFA